jgi:drug/metabolite transporter (DMT)-like permease
MFAWAVWLPLGGALSYACFQVLTRRLASLENPFLTHFWTGLVGSLVLTMALGLGPIGLADIERAVQPSMLLWLIGIGLAGTLGHLLLILALGMAPTSTLTPYAYAQIAFAAAIGWWAFGTVPDGWSWIGMGVIAACGACSAWLSIKATSSTSTIEGCPSTSRSIPRTRKPAC